MGAGGRGGPLQKRWTNRGGGGSQTPPARLGQEATSGRSRFMTGSIAGLLNDDPASRYIQDALGVASTKDVSSSGSFDRLLSFFGKADYSYAQRYYASATLRRHMATQNARGNGWGKVPGSDAGGGGPRQGF